jgi:hypothetical protein
MGMKKRRLWLIGLLLILGVGTAVSPLRHAVRGWLSGESFVEGWPISYWVNELTDPDGSVRQRATSVLARGGARSENAVPALVAALDDSRAEVRWGAAHALGEIGQRAEQAIPALSKMLSHRSAADRAWAATGIGLFGPNAKAAVPMLIERLADDAPNVRGKVAWALGRVGPSARAAVPKLRERAEDGASFEGRPFVQTVGEMVCAALWEIDPAYAGKENIPRVVFPWNRFGTTAGGQVPE